MVFNSHAFGFSPARIRAAEKRPMIFHSHAFGFSPARILAAEQRIMIFNSHAFDFSDSASGLWFSFWLPLRINRHRSWRTRTRPTPRPMQKSLSSPMAPHRIEHTGGKHVVKAADKLRKRTMPGERLSTICPKTKTTNEDLELVSGSLVHPGGSRGKGQQTRGRVYSYPCTRPCT